MVASGGCGDCGCDTGAPCDDRVRVTDLDLRSWVPGGRVAAIPSVVGRSSAPPNVRRMLDPARSFWGTQQPLPRLAASVPIPAGGFLAGGLGAPVAVRTGSGCAFEAAAGGQIAHVDPQLGAQGVAEASVPASGARKRAGDLVATSEGGVAESEGGDPDAGEDEADALDDLIDALGGASGDDVVDQGPHRVHALVDSYLTDVFGGCPIPAGPTMTIPPGGLAGATRRIGGGRVLRHCRSRDHPAPRAGAHPR